MAGDPMEAAQQWTHEYPQHRKAVERLREVPGI
jgi:ferric-dicitrate binding protein FerR (iron transport regulator)